MLELDKFINDLNDFFAESDNAFHVLETHFLNFLCAIHRVAATDMTHF